VFITSGNPVSPSTAASMMSFLPEHVFRALVILEDFVYFYRCGKTMKMKTVLPYLFCIFISTVNCHGFPYNPWGPWTTYPLNERVAVVRVYNSERFYQNGIGGGILIHENHPYEGTSGPIFGTNGALIKIEKYEPTDYGYLFYLISDGIRHTTDKTEFKDDVRMQVKMIFLDRDTCKFEFIALYDEEGYRFNTFLKENEIYHRYRVEDD
jgi:hypothetical protein